MLNICLILSVNYIVGNIIFDNKYNMSKNHIKYEKINFDKKADFDFLLDKKDISVVVETKNENVIGLYDPTMYYYINSTSINYPYEYRYFSNRDYEEKKDVSILINNIQEELKGNSTKYKNNIVRKYKTKIINVFDYN